MILYFNSPNANFINSIIEYDLMKNIPPSYNLNLLISDKNKQKENNEENIEKISNSQSNTNVNNIQRELINLLSYDLDSTTNELEKDDDKEENFENNPIINFNKNNRNDNSLIKNEMIFTNSYYNNNNRNDNKIDNINNPTDLNMNMPTRINSNLNNNLNDYISANMGSNMGANIKYFINNNYINKFNKISNNNIKNNPNNLYINVNNNNPNNINVNKSINNINNNNIINNRITKDLYYNNNINNNSDNFSFNLYRNNFNSFLQNKIGQNLPNVAYLLPNYNIDHYSKNNINNYDNNNINKHVNNTIDNVNKVSSKNFQNIRNKNNINSSINNIGNMNNIQNINYINNINYLNDMNSFNNMFNIDNPNNNNLHKKKSNSIKDNKYTNMSLLEITNKLDMIAKKQPGCRFLENLIKTNENSFEIINKIFYPKLYWVKLYELSNDLFGNYFIQTIIPELDDNNLISFTNLINSNLLKLCLNPHGTRVVQVLIENIKNKNNLLVLFTNCLSKIMGKLIYDLNGSFVLMHFAKEIKDNELIYNFLNSNIIEISMNTYSCSALQKFIDIGTIKQKNRLLNNIVNNANNLIGNQCGLYVLQFVMDKKNYQINDRILEKFIINIIQLSKRKYSSNVIEKCLETCSPEMVKKLINIFNNETIIRDLIKDIFGNYVIQKLLSICQDDKTKNHILTIISSEFNSLSNLPFGHKLIKKLAMTYPQIKSML